MSNRPVLNVLWFKRDLRLRDHAPLKAAVEANQPLLLLYCFEPSVIADPNYDPRHWRFVTECLADLNQQLHSLTPRPPLPGGEGVEQHEWLPFEFADEPEQPSVSAGVGSP